MAKKSVRNQIFDKFAEAVGKDDLFEGVADNLISLVQQEKLSKTEIKNLLRKRQ